MDWTPSMPASVSVVSTAASSLSPWPPNAPRKKPPPKLPAGLTVTPLPTSALISSSRSENAAFTVIMMSVSPTLTASTATSRPVRSGLRRIDRRLCLMVLIGLCLLVGAR